MTANATNGLVYASGNWQNQPLEQPLSILVLNLMPTRQNTELQFLSRFNDCDREVQLTFMYPVTHHFRGTPRAQIEAHYVSLAQIQDQFFDGLIITGAPVETLKFEAVDYWDEFVTITDWASTHVKEQLYECWAAQAGLYHDFGIEKHLLPRKLFGIYSATKVNHESPLARGFGAGGLIRMPQSRKTESVLDENDLPAGLTVVASSLQSGPIILSAPSKQTTYVTGHPEYQEQTLAEEYLRDVKKHLPIQLPEHYFEDSTTGMVHETWREASIKFYQNWTQLLTDKKVGLSL
ncbi:homoserine O-succinyltransferase [Lentilactobacillus sp. IMAU92037]|uniref:homoserine O-acetyltransferase/O-succinyltransferase family protein n=1 Tax=Lentilactobacillus TaxID=2767893 RepID=UPI001C2811E7|nr:MULTISPECIES: homoserine O-succinyltransferase [Lentilactobacillus]MBU9789099.1 homoserine O-succinyltransferase [Lentilactobacillus dabitei]MBV0930189.1 homoserine O-succinyltransferase [Lentilactobacillus dabitei]MDM7516834.1 homoserine O-succinyltransferase [Lentilactobacillus sp. TOM.63]